MARQHKNSSGLDLDALARDLGRARTGQRLSDEARSRLFSSVTEAAEPGPLAALFLPIRRLTLAAVLPALVLGVVLVGVASRTPVGPAVAAGTTVSAEKAGDEVVFRIANGGQAHRVTRSELADGVATESAFDVLGEYRDRLAGDSEIVFYRID